MSEVSQLWCGLLLNCSGSVLDPLEISKHQGNRADLSAVTVTGSVEIFRTGTFLSQCADALKVKHSCGNVSALMKLSKNIKYLYLLYNSCKINIKGKKRRRAAFPLFVVFCLFSGMEVWKKRCKSCAKRDVERTLSILNWAGYGCDFRQSIIISFWNRRHFWT